MDGVDLELYAGEVHALVGQNGAGKSTLIKLIVGGLKRDSGEIMLNGETKNYLSPEQACHDGIGVIYQETSLISQMTVLENIFLGVEPLNVANLIDENKMRKKFFETCNLLRIVMDPDQIVSRLSIVKKKLVEIMKALVRESRILIMDEPTDSLQKQEINHLLKIIEDLKSNQAAVFYITHKFEEVFRVADRISVLRDGKKVQTANVPDTTIDEVIRLMAGESRVTREEIKTSPDKKRQTVLKVEGVTKKNTLHNVSFDLQAGEIVAITGLVGAGKTELARIL
ncbi:MAG: sugar ABC transporter ATP-binding protein, partial [Deltaproteobacteria bacterium]|nr:sugar ABC transporter ATP-binding protein [Deltaproteobacteria bacterium]